MKFHEFKVQVTRTEIHTVSEADLQKERMFQQGKADRIAGKPSASSNGAYLNGWYDPDCKHYYIEEDAAHLL